MKIGYFADGPWSHRALEKIIREPDLKIVFIVARFDNPDPVLREFAEHLKVPFLVSPDVNSLEFINAVRQHSADINVSMSFNQILRKAIIQSTPEGFINCHAGALPFYRGRNILNWALINGEQRFGVTVHYVDEGIDTGDIILQRFAEITPQDDYGTLLNKAIDVCSEVLHEAIMSIVHGKAQKISQSSIHPVGFYCSQRKNGDEWIDWSLPSQSIHNLVRGIATPGPCARSYVRGKEIAVLKTVLIPNAPNYIDKPGRIVGRDQEGVIVKTGDTTLRITKIAEITEGGDKKEEQTPRFPIGTDFEFCYYELVNLYRRIYQLEQLVAKYKKQLT